MFNRMERAGALLLLAGCVWLKATPVAAQAKDTTSKKKVDSVALAKALLPAAFNAPKPYKEIIPATAKTSNGFFKVHLVNDRYLFEIPDSLMGRDLLIVNRIAKAAADLHNTYAQYAAYAGDEMSNCVIRFEKAPGNKVMLETISFNERASDSTANGLFRSWLNNNTPAIQAAFPVKANNEPAKSTVIDVTDFVNSDNAITGFNGSLKFILPLGPLMTDRSYIKDIHAFAMNIEIASVKTFSAKPAAPLQEQMPPGTYEMNSSIVLLPKVPMQGRLLDKRVGFFADQFVNFDVNPQGIAKQGYIWRWRMEPKPEDMEKYKHGELVEPQKPIVIYIDPATPEKWVPYLIKGINDWQAAFEKAGFKNAIIGKEAPVNDTTWSLEDAQHSALIYKPSNVANASGPSIKDPRSGEILETHINWYHNVMDVLYKWYFIQAGAIDKRAQKPQLDDTLMGELIRFVSSHEIGHTLGLRHNWGASSTVPVDSLRSKAWVEAHGHTPSIMDYARFNYVAQPEDGITEKGIFPRIGDYDKWAIEWGYKLIPDAHSAEAEKPLLNQWVINKLKSGKQFYFGIETVPGDATTGNDPRNQNEDLGDDAMKASAYGIENLKRIEIHLQQWTREPNEDYEKAGDMYKEIVNQYQRYMGHVIKNIGGIYTTPKTVEQTGQVYDFVSREKQQRAVAFLQEQLFTTPTWLIDKKLYALSATDFNNVADVQKKALLQLLNGGVMNRLVIQQASVPAGAAYTPAMLLNDLKKGIFSELAAGKPIDIFRRNLQKMYVNDLVALLPPNNGKAGINSESDVPSVLRTHTRDLAAAIKNGVATASDAVTREHLDDLYERLHQALEAMRNGHN